MRKISLLSVFLLACICLNGQSIVQGKFIIYGDTITVHRPDDAYIRKLSEMDISAWNQIRFCTDYLDKMQKYMKQERSLSLLPELDDSLDHVMYSFQERRKHNRKVSKMLSMIRPEWFQDEYNAYIKAEKEHVRRTTKPRTFLSRKDSVAFNRLCDEIIASTGKDYRCDSVYYDINAICFHYIYADLNDPNNKIGFSCQEHEDGFRLHYITGFKDDLYTIWIKYFGGKKEKSFFKEDGFTHYESLKLRIEGQKDTKEIRFLIYQGEWIIKI